MTLNELKEDICTSNYAGDSFILLCEDTKFIAFQYIDELCQNMSFGKVYVSSLSEIQNSMTLGISDMFYVLNVDTLDAFPDHFEDINNCCIICGKISKSIKERAAAYTITVPKLLEWQIKAYMKFLIPQADENDINQLYTKSNGNIYKIVNEIDKAVQFSKDKRLEALHYIINEPYSDLNYAKIFDLSDAILKKDLMRVSDCLYKRNMSDFEPTGLVTILLRDYKKILFVNFNSGLSPSELGITDKQANAIRYYYKNYTEDELRKKIKFLSGIDAQLKLGKLDIGYYEFLDYIICGLLGE